MGGERRVRKRAKQKKEGEKHRDTQGQAKRAGISWYVLESGLQPPRATLSSEQQLIGTRLQTNHNRLPLSKFAVTTNHPFKIQQKVA